MLNILAMTGRIVETPELRYTKSNQTPVTSFRIAVRRDFGKGSEVETDFFDCVAWRATAEFVSKHFAKGNLIQITGRLENRKWEDKHGQKRVSTEIIVANAYFGEGKSKDGDNSAAPQGFDPFDESDAPADSEEDLPF